MKMKYKDSKAPDKLFIYVVGRPYLPLAPEQEFFPEALTEEKGDKIVEFAGRPLEIRFDTSSRRFTDKVPPFVSTRAKLIDYAKIPFDGRGPGLEFEVFGGVYRFHIDAEDSDEIKKLIERRDKYIESTKAFERAQAHWGTERWGGSEYKSFWR